MPCKTTPPALILDMDLRVRVRKYTVVAAPRLMTDKMTRPIRPAEVSIYLLMPDMHLVSAQVTGDVMQKNGLTGKTITVDLAPSGADGLPVLDPDAPGWVREAIKKAKL